MALPPDKISTPPRPARHWPYLALSLAAPLYYGAVTLHHVFSHEFIVQDDMRQHVVWFQQFLDPALFNGDAIAQYFRSVAPPGVTAVYWLGVQMGIEPLLLAKLLPLPLALIATVFLFYTTLAIAPLPRAAWIATLIFNQHLWLNDDLVSATPRAFVYPLFAAFLYYAVRPALIPMLVSLALLGLCFPQMMLVAVATLVVGLVGRGPSTRWRNWMCLTRDRRRWLAAILGLGVAIAVALPFAAGLSDYGEAVTAAQMRSLPEYRAGGRNEYFGMSPASFLLHGSSGVRIPVFPSIIWAGFALPFVLRRKSSSTPFVTSQKILQDLMVGSFGLYLLAHLLLLRLHFPSRYLYHSWRFVLPIAAGIVLAALMARGRSPKPPPQAIKASAFASAAKPLYALAAVLLIGVPMLPPLMLAFQGWVVGEIPAVYRYLETQPTNIQVASLAPEGNNLPAFAHRSAWVGREFALPHHPQYYAIVRQRTADLLRALYSPEPSDLLQWLDQTGVNFLLVEGATFEPGYLRQDWLANSSLRPQVKDIMAQRGSQPAILSALSACSVITTARYDLVDTACLRTQLAR